MSLKLESARRQLGTALSLFLEDKDPVSVHCLVCAAIEVVEFYAAKQGGGFLSHALATNAGMTAKDLHDIQRQFFNALKHASTLAGKERDDEALLGDIDDSLNDSYLFVGWADYLAATKTMPVEAQVFHAWYLARFPGKLASQANAEPFKRYFPGLRAAPRGKAKMMLRDKIRHARTVAEIMVDERTDPRPLVLGWPPA